MKNAALQGNRGGLSAVAGFQFRKNMPDVKFDSDFGDPERAADFFIASAFGDKFQNFDFAGGEFGAGQAFSEPRADGGRDATFPGVNAADGLDQIFASGGFEQVGAGAGLE